MPRKKKDVDLKRTPKVLEGDETPAGYLGYPSPPEPGQINEAKTTTLDTQGTQNQPLDPALAGPDAQAAEREQQRTRESEQARQKDQERP
jgi:hypothetical protein